MTRHPVIHSGHSIHDLRFKKSAVQGDDISHGKSSPKQEQDDRVIRRTYWRNNFIVALAPFGLVGVPLQVLIPTSNGEDSTIANQKVAQWLKFRFRSPVVALLTILVCPAWMAVNYNFFSQAWRLLDHVVLQGLLVISDLVAVVELVYLLPLFIMVNYTWLYGDNIHAFIQSLDAPHIFEQCKIQPKKVPMENVWIPQNNDQKGPKIPKPWLKELSFRLKLLKLYAIILVSHMVHFLTATHRAQQDKWDSGKLNSYTIIYFRMLGYLLIIPLFVTTCAAIGSQATATTSFIRSCIINKQRKAQDLHLIKKAYERIADSILMANHLFSLFIPLVVIVFGFGALMNDMVSLNAGAASEVAKAWFTTKVIPSIYQTFAASTKGGPLNVRNVYQGSNQSGNVSFDNATFNLEEIFQGIDANEKSNSTAFDIGAAVKKGIQVPAVPPEEVRYLVGLTFQTLLYGLIIWLAVLEAIRTNDKVRYLQIWINDLASEGTAMATHSSPLKPDVPHVSTNQDGQKEDEDFSREFTFLKFYVHSRMESQAPSQCALLNIRGLSLASGYLNKRLSGYPISH